MVVLFSNAMWPIRPSSHEPRVQVTAEFHGLFSKHLIIPTIHHFSRWSDCVVRFRNRCWLWLRFCDCHVLSNVRVGPQLFTEFYLVSFLSHSTHFFVVESSASKKNKWPTKEKYFFNRLLLGPSNETAVLPRCTEFYRVFLFRSSGGAWRRRTAPRRRSWRPSAAATNATCRWRASASTTPTSSPPSSRWNPVKTQ